MVDLARAHAHTMHRCLVVQEDTPIASIGGDIALHVNQRAFRTLAAPAEVMATPNVPVPHCTSMQNAVIPHAESIAKAMARIIRGTA